MRLRYKRQFFGSAAFEELEIDSTSRLYPFAAFLCRDRNFDMICVGTGNIGLIEYLAKIDGNPLEYARPGGEGLKEELRALARADPVVGDQDWFVGLFVGEADKKPHVEVSAYESWDRDR